MREIKFRAIGIDKGEWVYGYVAFDSKKSNAVIIHKQANNEMQHTAVRPETVTEMTGLRDKNGVEIYEGDIVRILYTDWASQSAGDTRTLEQYWKDIAPTGVVEFKDCEFGVKICSDILDSIHCGKHGFIEVIGNIFEENKTQTPNP